MKRLGTLAAVLALALAVPALAQQRVFSKTFTQNLTGSAPTLATDGVDLTNAAGYSVVVSAASGQTITGGTLLCYYSGSVSANAVSGTAPTQRWMRCPSTLDITPGTSVRDAPSGDFEVLVGFGRLKYVPSSITVSSGSTVDVTITVRLR